MVSVRINKLTIKFIDMIEIERIVDRFMVKDIKF